MKDIIIYVCNDDFCEDVSVQAVLHVPTLVNKENIVKLLTEIHNTLLEQEYSDLLKSYPVLDDYYDEEDLMDYDGDPKTLLDVVCLINDWSWNELEVLHISL